MPVPKGRVKVTTMDDLNAVWKRARVRDRFCIKVISSRKALGVEVQVLDQGGGPGTTQVAYRNYGDRLTNPWEFGSLLDAHEEALELDQRQKEQRPEGGGI